MFRNIIENFLVNDPVKLEQINIKQKKEINRARKIGNELSKFIDNDHYDFDMCILLDSLPALIFLKDIEDKLIYVNRTFLEIFNLIHKEIIGKKVSEIFIGQKNYLENDREVIITGLPKRNILEQAKTFDGKTVWLNTDKFPIYNKDNSPKGIMGFSYDITRFIEG